MSVAKALYLVVGDVSEAEDLAEEAFARVWARWDRVAALASPAGYVYRAALNLHRNRLRRVARDLRHRRAPTQPADPADEVSDLDELRRTLASLPPGQREALVLVEWFGLSTAEAAVVLRIKPGSVRVRLSRARTALGLWAGDRVPEQEIAFLSNRSGRFQLFVMNTDGSDLNQLTHFAATTVGDAVWSPDATELAVSAGGDDFLYVLAADGSVLRKIEPAPGYGVGDLAWRPVAATPTPSDTASVAALSPCTADQLHLTTGMQGENTTARIGVNVDNLGAPCVVPPSLGPITITIERGAGDASVKGNPLTLPLPRRIRHGTAALQLAGIWSNWCGSQPGLRIFVRFEGSVISSRTSFVPECLWPGSPSTLVSIR